MNSNAKSSPGVRLSFHGAARTVTGSKYLVEAAKKKLLVDCGIFQGKKELRLKNRDEPTFDPKELDAIVLTHGHIDHVGYLPLLVRRGFQSPIYCTPATKEILNIVLPDNARLQEEEARYANKHGTSKHRPAKPLFSAHDVYETLQLVQCFERDEDFLLFPGVSVTASCAGHILGSACLSLDVHGKRITFSGDLGRYNTPILPDPKPVDFGDLLLVESTYGNRTHAEADVKQGLARVVRQAADRKGPLIIPAFSIGRTQNILYYLAELEREGSVPVLPVYVDSPMAVNVTNVYRSFHHDYDEDAKEILRAGETPLLTENTTFCPKASESKQLNSLCGARILISASGMVTGGRILHHMTNWLPEEETTVLFVGYQAEGTRGRTIQSGAKEVKIFGKYVPIRAEVETISGFSAHADQVELLRWLESSSGSPGMVKVVHGEKEATDVFSEVLRKKFDWNASPAEYLETVEI